MEWLAPALITGVVTFTATNVDDILVLTVFYSQINGVLRKRHIVAGQYLGFAALVLISLLGFLIGLVVPRAYIGLLGLLPIAIGIRKFLHRHDEVERKQQVEGKTANSSFLWGLFSRQAFGVAAVTFANGGDNIGVYTPLFASSGSARLLVLLSVFFVLLGVWCYVGYRLARQPAVAQAFARYGHIFVPFVLVGLGLLIIMESGTFMLVKLWLTSP